MIRFLIYILSFLIGLLAGTFLGERVGYKKGHRRGQNLGYLKALNDREGKPKILDDYTWSLRDRWPRKDDALMKVKK